ncbi:hypothetical protein J7J08_04825 [Stenotrophomonas sp. ISL-67]|uniref:hypothetical protein n=1 Tax=Stenotrophomonas sp. ISL-67 TaxID=2819171 RepID=UPI001BE5D185|nr:hypothetical protein [Stenotrophomonas sp. ISL-67]MBT2766950.1 hypothetical protein [Stenotrophomonas sp. ISL-67]
MIKHLSIILLAIMLTPACSEISGVNDAVHGAYENYSAAAKSSAFENGWLPMQMPRSATRIEEIHNVDSGEIWIRFNYDGRDIKDLIGECSASSSVDLPDARRTTRLVAWWPEELTNPGRKNPSSAWTLYYCSEMNHAGSSISAGIAIDASASLALYWVGKR